MLILLLTIILSASEIEGQAMTPMDSLYAGDSLSFGLQLVLKPVQWWQHFSYSSSALNCQFESSCSNFMVEAIQNKGIIKGTVIGTDRILRCNPAARHYHMQLPNAKLYYDGRLVDPVNWEKEAAPGKSPALAVTLSLIPGLGRTYAGHPVDGLLSLLFVGGFAFNAYNQNEAGNPIRASINLGLMTLFWSADFYGAYRTAKMVPPHSSRP